jgi:nucleoside-diphosphate kinase
MMTSGPVVLLVLKAPNAIPKWRVLMGATNPSQADEGTMRHLFGKDIQDNAVHGSDSPENAAKEIKQFFPALLK